MNLDMTKPVDRVRCNISDVSDVPFLSDAVIQYELDKAKNNELQASKVCAYYILGILARSSSNSRVDVFVNDTRSTYKAYAEFLNAWLRDPRSSVYGAGVYGGGISKLDIDANNDNPDVVGRQKSIFPTDSYDVEQPQQLRF
jgi:hypothetical protein